MFKFTFLLGVEDTTIEEVKLFRNDVEHALSWRKSILAKEGKETSKAVEFLEEILEQTDGEIDRAHKMRMGR